MPPGAIRGGNPDPVGRSIRTVLRLGGIPEPLTAAGAGAPPPGCSSLLPSQMRKRNDDLRYRRLTTLPPRTPLSTPLPETGDAKYGCVRRRFEKAMGAASRMHRRCASMRHWYVQVLATSPKVRSRRPTTRRRSTSASISERLLCCCTLTREPCRLGPAADGGRPHEALRML